MNAPSVAGTLFKSCLTLKLEMGPVILPSPVPDTEKLLNKCLLNLYILIYLWVVVHLGVQYIFTLSLIFWYSWFFFLSVIKSVLETVRHKDKQHSLQADVFQLTHTAPNEKDILPPGGKCLCSARKIKWLTELGTNGSGQPWGIILQVLGYDYSSKHWIPIV